MLPSVSCGNRLIQKAVTPNDGFWCVTNSRGVLSAVIHDVKSVENDIEKNTAVTLITQVFTNNDCPNCHDLGPFRISSTFTRDARSFELEILRIVTALISRIGEITWVHKLTGQQPTVIVLINRAWL